MTTPTDKLDDLSWVQFSEKDNPSCEVVDCSCEAVKRIRPIGCCNDSFPYCVEHFKEHRHFLEEELSFGEIMHRGCGGFFYDFVVEDI